MRTPIALAICVSLAAGSFAETAPEGTAPEWTTTYAAGLAASQRRNYEEALGFYERSWETSRAPDERGASATGIGQTYRHLGRIKEAQQWLERAWQEWSADPRQGFSLAVTAGNLAELYRTTGDYVGAERLLREALVSPSCDAEARGLIRNNLADLLREEGRITEAQLLFQESIDSGTVPWQLRAGALIGLADIDGQKGDWEAGIGKWNEVLEICRREKDEKTEAIALRGFAVTWLRSGAAARAEPLLRRSLRMMENNPDMPPEQIASTLASMGELYRSENKLALAEGEWSRALQIDRAALGEAHPQVAWLMEMLADLYSARGEFSLAREYATRASQMMSGSFGEYSMPAAVALTNRAVVEQRASDLDAAAKDYEHAIAIARAHPEHRAIEAGMIRRYAGLLKAMHRTREAKAMLTQGDIGARSFRR